jgi:cobalt-zinc-cadmium efflux system protein
VSAHAHDHPHPDGPAGRRAHDDGRGHGHAHVHGAAALRAGARHQRPLALALVLVVAFLGVQIGVGVATGSLALLSDAGHMATDALGLAMALAAIRLASRADQRAERTFGLYRLEILAALANAVLLLGVAGYVLYEAASRLSSPPAVASVPVFVVGLVGLAVNVVAFVLLRAGSKESINVEGAYLEVVSDTLGSVGVVVGAVVMWTTGWHRVDAIVGAAIGLFVVPRAWRLGRTAVRVLIQEAPAGFDLAGIAADLSAIDGVADVHDLHLWTLTSEMEVLTAHLMTTAGVDAHGVLDRAREVLVVRHGIAHATLQVEPDTHEGCDDVSW